MINFAIQIFTSMPVASRLVTFFIIAFLFGVGGSQAQSLVLNEIMSSNAVTLADDDGDYEDWIEFYNFGNEPVSLEGYGLSDDFANPYRWVFPDVMIQPGEFMLVWASGKDRRNPGAALHSNFSLSAGGEEIILTNAVGLMIDTLSPTPLTSDVSYGRVPDGQGVWRFFTEPTPNEANQGTGYGLLLGPVDFSHSAGAFTEAFLLNLSHTQADAEIVYSLDGAEPNASAPVFEEAISIRDRTDEPNDISTIPTNFLDVGPPYFEGWQMPLGQVFKVNVVRARALHPDAPPGPVTTHTYLVHPNGYARYNLPWFSLATKRENLFDDETGIYVQGNNNNYFQDGEEWERLANLSFFETNGMQAFSEDLGLRLHGNTSRSRPRKSLRMSFRAEYGNSWLNYPLFPSKVNTLYKRFILRNSGNDWGLSTYRDAFHQSLVKNLHVETQYFRPVVLFINGEYWGIHNLRDRYNHHHLEAHYGIAEDEMTFLENDGRLKFGSPSGLNHYTNLRNYIGNNNLAFNPLFEQVKTMMDVESFTDFQLTHIFVMNTDWPGNNSLFWRYNRNGYEPGAGVRDGRWRWMILDTDFGFGLDLFYVPGVNQGPAHNTLAFALDPNGPNWPNPPWSTFMLRKLLYNKDYKHYFINRFADLLNTTFSTAHTTQLIDSIQELLQPGMQEHINRWRSPASMHIWWQNIEVMRDFAQQRPGYLRNYIRSQFGLQGQVQIQLLAEQAGMGSIQINTISPQMDAGWSGIYFINVPLQLKAVAAPGYRFVEWAGDASGQAEQITITPTNDAQYIARFEISNDFAGDSMNPAAYRLANGPYVFGYWDTNNPQRSYPIHMVFQQSSMDDPRLSDEMTAPYYIPEDDYHGDDAGNIGFPYRLTRRTRINALGGDGISFINTGRGRDLGAALLAIDTRGLQDVVVSWTGGTIGANSRVYAIRLQYRIGHEGHFINLTDSTGNYIEYRRNSQNGHSQDFSSIRLPADANNQAYVQLRWKYYFTGQQLDSNSGTRDELRLDDILVRTLTMGLPDQGQPAYGQLQLSQNQPNPVATTTNISYQLAESGPTLLVVYNQFGSQIATIVDEFQSAGKYAYAFDASRLPAGLYVYSIMQHGIRLNRKMLVIK
jgi:hypothetical protein